MGADSGECGCGLAGELRVSFLNKLEEATADKDDD